jgi:hypothetical protein
MAKKNELLNSFSTSRKQKSVAEAKPALSPEDIDRIAETVESTPNNAAPTPIEDTPIAIKEVLVKTSLDFPVALYEDMKITLFKKRRSMKEYILELVRQDLYGKQ